MQNVDFLHRIKPMGLTLAVAAATLGLAACGGSSSSSKSTNPSEPVIPKVVSCDESSVAGARVICVGKGTDLSDKAVQDHFMNQLAQAQSGDTFVLPQGRYKFNRTVGTNGLDEDNQKLESLTFRGAGMKKTIIDTSGATSDGFLFNNTDKLVFEDFGIYESNNNALKIKGSNGVIIRRMATVWETDYQATNGAYGLYPVETRNVLIEDSFVQGSADAGIYVGQSDSIVVRNNIAVKNVAGIEIENSTNADVYGNTAEGNTGGILIFDLPIGNGKYGSGVRIFDNDVIKNNAPNFANVSDFAGGVHIVPPGTGVIVLSTSDVEIYNNRITDHQTTSIAITSYMLPDASLASEPNADVGGAVMSYGDIHPYATELMDGWSPLVRNVNIHHNSISVAAGVDKPEGKLIKDIIAGYKSFHEEAPHIANGKATIPHILYDGVGELLANTPYTQDPDDPLFGATILQAIVGGINQVATAVDTNIPDTEPFTPIDLAKFVAYTNDGVCQSDNGIDNTNLFAATVFQTQPTAYNFSNGEPFSKLELLAKGRLDMVNTIMADPLNEITCASGTGFKGTPAVVEFAGTKYGCADDDKESAVCKL